MSWETALDNRIHDYLPDLKWVENEPMAKHTSFRIGGPARRMAFPKDGSQMVLLIEAARTCGARPLVIGNGTNLLFPDEGVDRLVVNTRDMSGVTLDAEGRVAAEAGASLSRVAVFAQQHGLAGLEFAHGIPGTVGGGVYMHAGAYGGAIRAVCRWSQEMLPDGTLVRREGVSQGFGYRTSVYQTLPCVIVRASLQLQPGDPNTIAQTMRALMEKRKASQPLELPSAGSTFKRPAGYFAGPRIEQAGRKGQGSGGAAVSEKHAGFVVNRGGATTDDIRRTMELVQTRVLETSGVQLEPEVRIW